MAPESEIASRIRTALAEHLKRDPSRIRPQDDLRKDLGLDSLAMIELLFKIEEAFDLEIPNDDLSQIATVGDVAAYVEQRLHGTPTAARPAAAAPKAVEAAPRPAARWVPVAAPAERAPLKATKRAAVAKKKGSRKG